MPVRTAVDDVLDVVVVEGTRTPPRPPVEVGGGGDVVVEFVGVVVAVVVVVPVGVVVGVVVVVRGGVVVRTGTTVGFNVPVVPVVGVTVVGVGGGGALVGTGVTVGCGGCVAIGGGAVFGGGVGAFGGGADVVLDGGVVVVEVPDGGAFGGGGPGMGIGDGSEVGVGCGSGLGIADGSAAGIGCGPGTGIADGSAVGIGCGPGTGIGDGSAVGVGGGELVPGATHPGGSLAGPPFAKSHEHDSIVGVLCGRCHAIASVRLRSAGAAVLIDVSTVLPVTYGNCHSPSDPGGFVTSVPLFTSSPPRAMSWACCDPILSWPTGTSQIATSAAVGGTLYVQVSVCAAVLAVTGAEAGFFAAIGRLPPPCTVHTAGQRRALPVTRGGPPVICHVCI